MTQPPKTRRRRLDVAPQATLSNAQQSAAPLPTTGRSADAVFGILALAAAGCGSAAVFLAEVLAGKILLPHFGGSPATWIMCLAFWQPFGGDPSRVWTDDPAALAEALVIGRHWLPERGRPVQ